MLVGFETKEQLQEFCFPNTTYQHCLHSLKAQDGDLGQHKQLSAETPQLKEPTSEFAQQQDKLTLTAPSLLTC